MPLTPSGELDRAVEAAAAKHVLWHGRKKWRNALEEMEVCGEINV